MPKSTQEILDENTALKEQVMLLVEESHETKQQLNKAMSEAYRYKSAYELLVATVTKSDKTF